jgi:hypothetical protein
MRTVSEIPANAAAVPCGSYRGRRCYRIPVTVDLNDSQLCATIARLRFNVIAPTAAAAADWTRDRFATRPETEIRATGPRGGVVKRFVGWQSAIGAELFDRTPRPLQLDAFTTEGAQ